MYIYQIFFLRKKLPVAYREARKRIRPAAIIKLKLIVMVSLFLPLFFLFKI